MIGFATETEAVPEVVATGMDKDEGEVEVEAVGADVASVTAQMAHRQKSFRRPSKPSPSTRL